MREADEIFLNTIRQGVAKNVDPMVWEALEKQVDEVGVRGLTGTGRALVEGLVRKHGSHNQASHNPHRGGSASSAGGGSSEGGGSSGGGGGLTAREIGKMDYKTRAANAGKLKAASEESRKDIQNAKGKGLQTDTSKGQLGHYEVGSNLVASTKHGSVMRGVEGGKLTTDNNVKMKVKGWKNRDDVAPGDTIAITTSRGTVQAYRVNSKSGEGIGARWSVSPIGKGKKPTRTTYDLSETDMGRGNSALTIVE